MTVVIQATSMAGSQNATWRTAKSFGYESRTEVVGIRAPAKQQLSWQIQMGVIDRTNRVKLDHSGPVAESHVLSMRHMHRKRSMVQETGLAASWRQQQQM